MIKSLLSGVVIAFSAIAAVASAGVVTAPHVNLNRYVGKWYEVASIPQTFQRQCVGNTTAEYSYTKNGRIKVVNSCDTAKGDRSVAVGRAEITDRTSNSKLKVTFVKIFGNWIFAFGGDYWILDVAPDYSFALVGDPTANYAWLLSRTPQISLATYAYAEAKFRSEGYGTCKILTSVQRGGFSSRIPLCKLVANGRGGASEQ